MDMLNDYCGVTRDARGLVRLTICNAGKLNILGSAVIDGVRAGLEALARQPVRVLVIAGQSERSMIGGADIKEMATLDQKGAEAFITRLRDLCNAARAFPVPVIARIPGYSLGGGLEFAACCDIRVTTRSAMFGMPEVKVGIPSVIHAALLPRLIGWSRTNWLLLTGENIDAQTALNWGLVDAVVPDDGLDAEIEKIAASILACGEQAIRAQKALLRHWENVPLDQAINDSVKTFGEAFLTGEPQHHMGAFVNRKRA
mgnify:CR=1 FL=1